MPNPNQTELRLIATYGEDPNATTIDGQSTNIYSALTDDSDEIDHKYVYGVPLGGLYVELAHYASVQQVVMQNISNFNGAYFYIDNTTAALVPGNADADQHVSFCDPDVATGIMLYAIAAEDYTEWHIAICGRRA